MSIELMKQALEALERGETKLRYEAITALREALAQPEQEPVACQYAKDVAMPEYRCAGKCQYAQPEQEQWDAIPDAFNEWWNADYDDTGNPYRKDSPAYWAWSGWKAASKQPEQEPVCDKDPQGCWNVRCQLGKVCKHAAPRQWQGLTDEEINSLWDGHVVPVFGKNGINPIVFARTIETRLKEKNT
jgi:hypothetical protein